MRVRALEEGSERPHSGVCTTGIHVKVINGGVRSKLGSSKHCDEASPHRENSGNKVCDTVCLGLNYKKKILSEILEKCSRLGSCSIM